MTDREKEDKPAAVSEETKQAGEIRARWAWVEPSVWTERMLTALEEGIKGGKWFSLMDKIYAERTLWAGFQQVKANGGAGGVDHQTVEDFERDLMKNLKRLSEQLREGSYRPQAVRRVWIPKPGSAEKRPLGVPTVRDRVVQAAMRLVLEPIFERDFAEQSYGFRPNRGCKDALRRVDGLLKQAYTWIVDADLKSYFDTIPHRAVEGTGGGEGVGRASPWSGGGLLEPTDPGRHEELDSRGGNPARSRAKSAAVEPLPEPSGPPDGTGRGGDGAVCR